MVFDTIILAIFGLGTTELILILLILILLFGGKRIYELLKGVGRGLKEFKKESDTEKENE